MRRRSSLALAAMALLAGACSGSRASIEIEGARASWVDITTSRRVNVDIDLLGHDQLGGSIGPYCATIAVPGQADKTECASDISDGDRKTMRVETTSDVGDAATIGIRIRHADIDIGRVVVGPVAPR